MVLQGAIGEEINNLTTTTPTTTEKNETTYTTTNSYYLILPIPTHFTLPTTDKKICFVCPKLLNAKYDTRRGWGHMGSDGPSAFNTIFFLKCRLEYKMPVAICAPKKLSTPGTLGVRKKVSKKPLRLDSRWIVQTFRKKMLYFVSFLFTFLFIFAKLLFWYHMAPL